MPSKDPELNTLVNKQTELFMKGAPIEEKVALLKLIQARQDQIYKNKKD